MKQTRLQMILTWVLLFTLTILFLVPFLWILLTSVKVDRDNFTLPPKIFPVAMTPDEYAERLENKLLLQELESDPDADPEALAAARAEPALSDLAATYGFAPTLEHYQRAFDEFPFVAYLRNTLIIVIFSTLGVLLSCSAGAYAFACLRWPDRGVIFAIVIGTMLLPFQVTLIPQFILFRWFGWINTLLPLIVPFFFGVPFYIFLLRQFFLTLPRDLFEAARIDGASEFRILVQIVLPLSRPALITVAIFAMMYAWNDFFGPLIYLSSETKKTLAVALQGLVSEFLTEWGLLMAAGTIMIVPIVILFFFAQRYFIEGITMTGMKG